MKKIAVLISVFCLMVSAVGCSGRETPSSDVPSEYSSADSSENADEPPGAESSAERENELKYYNTEDGCFRFGVKPELEETESEEYEYTFTNGEKDSLIGILSLTGYHQTAKGFSESILSDYKEVYDNVKGEEMTIGNAPAYRVTADAEGGIVYTSTMVQYGNGDLFVVNTTEAKGSEKCAEQTEIILNGLEFTGEPLKSENETFENDYFSVTIPEKFYFHKSDNESAAVRLNLQNSISELLYTFSIDAMTGETDIKAIADAAYEKSSDKNSIAREASEFSEYPSERITFTDKISGETIITEQHFFKVNGTCFRVTIVCSDSMLDRFDSEMQPIIDKIVFK